MKILLCFQCKKNRGKGFFCKHCGAGFPRFASDAEREKAVREHTIEKVTIKERINKWTKRK